jgi:voltage-gated potassium channel
VSAVNEEAPRASTRRETARGTTIVTVLTVVGGALAFALAPIRGERSWIGAIVGLAAAAIVVPITVKRARAIAKSDRPILDAIETLALIFTLLVFGFAAVYVVLAAHTNEMADIHTKIDAVYFTVSTLGTVGFGDAHAVGQAARLIVTFQMVFDLVFVAVSVRLLTGVAQRRASERRTPS